MKRRLWVLTALLWSRPAQGTEKTALALSFEEALRLAAERPANIVMAHERVQQAVARLGQTEANLLPQVTASASQSRQTRNLAAQGLNIPGLDPRLGPFN